MSNSSRRIQIVFTAPFLVLLLLSAGCFGGAYVLYRRATVPPVPPIPAPYYVNRTLTAVKPCFQCLDIAGKLKESNGWKIGKAADIPSGEQWWFAPAQETLDLPKIDGVPMLAVHPALDQKEPWQGFDQHRVFLVVFQDLDPKFSIEHPAPPPTPIPVSPQPLDSAAADSPAPTSTAPQQP